MRPTTEIADQFRVVVETGRTTSNFAVLEPGYGHRNMGSHIGAIETSRLLLVRWSDEYSEEFAELCADAEAMRFISGGRPLSREEVELILGRTRALWQEFGFGPWAALEKRTGRWVGRVGLNLLADWPGQDKWEVGFEFAREFWGRGFATESARRAIRFGWAQTPLNRIISVTRSDHLASRRVMERCGLAFQEELPYRGTTVVWYAIDRPLEWHTGAEEQAP